MNDTDITIRSAFPHDWLPATLRWGHKDDDDDDLPPCPAALPPFPRLPLFGAESELEAA